MGIAACASAGGGPSPSLTFDPALQVNLAEMTQRPSGLYVKELAAGSGAPAITGDFVRMEYTLSLANGTRIDGVEPGQPPFEFQLGQRQVIAGWEEGVTGIRAGARRRLVIPALLGYGMRPHGNIPSGSVLVVDLHVLRVGR